MPPGLPVRFVLYGLVPLVACVVALRQAYLSKFDELSTWKGGGMGMFASADSTDTRFLRFYIEKADGQREPIIGLTERQTGMMERILWFPRESAYEPLARSIRRTSFVASNEPSPVWSYTETGERLKDLARKHHLLHANRARPDGEEPDWTLVMEYYRLSYDPTARRAKFVLTDSRRYPEGPAR
jgi:hypothetical protein